MYGEMDQKKRRKKNPWMRGTGSGTVKIRKSEEQCGTVDMDQRNNMRYSKDGSEEHCGTQ